ncbi:MAG: adenosylcobinamide-GDP ribazoletransferase [Pleurocapsa sp.]
MLIIPTTSFLLSVKQLIISLGSSVTFYTVIPVPQKLTGEWSRIARWSPIIGLIIGATLSLLNLVLQLCNISHLTRTALIVVGWVSITGGLHLDGAMDTADGLSVTDRDRSLDVMRDSATGAFGAMAATIIILLKTCALYEIDAPLWLVLMFVAGWGRWGQVMAIALYPYLRATGKGSFHKENMRLPQDILWGLFFLLALSSCWYWWGILLWWQVLLLILISSAIALMTGYYFDRRLQGHTGDTYGAVVEWTEALILCCLTAIGH